MKLSELICGLERFRKVFGDDAIVVFDQNGINGYGLVEIKSITVNDSLACILTQDELPSNSEISPGAAFVGGVVIGGLLF